MTMILLSSFKTSSAVIRTITEACPSSTLNRVLQMNTGRETVSSCGWETASSDKIV